MSADKKGDTPESVPPLENTATQEGSSIADQSNLPVRFREARYRVHDDVLGNEFARDLGGWLFQHRELLTIGGDGIGRYNHEVLNLEQHYDMGPLAAMLSERIAVDLPALGIGSFDFDRFEAHAILYHHGSFFAFHDDTPGSLGEKIETRRAAFSYYMHSTPAMFEGGQLEFADGSTIEPKNDRLVVFDHEQKHRVNRVQCYSADLMHGRWSITGWVHSRRELMHFNWTPGAVHQGACDLAKVGGGVTGWPQDVTCPTCQQDLKLVLADHCTN